MAETKPKGISMRAFNVHMQMTEITIEGKFTPEGVSVSAYGEDNEVLEETWFTWDEVENLKHDSHNDFVFELLGDGAAVGHNRNP